MFLQLDGPVRVMKQRIRQHANVKQTKVIIICMLSVFPCSWTQLCVVSIPISSCRFVSLIVFYNLSAVYFLIASQQYIKLEVNNAKWFCLFATRTTEAPVHKTAAWIKSFLKMRARKRLNCLRCLGSVEGNMNHVGFLPHKTFQHVGSGTFKRIYD